MAVGLNVAAEVRWHCNQRQARFFGLESIFYPLPAPDGFGFHEPGVYLHSTDAHQAPMSILSGLLDAIDWQEALRLFHLFR